jgi:hypothetical protein
MALTVIQALFLFPDVLAFDAKAGHRASLETRNSDFLSAIFADAEGPIIDAVGLR